MLHINTLITHVFILSGKKLMVNLDEANALLCKVALTISFHYAKGAFNDIEGSFH